MNQIAQSFIEYYGFQYIALAKILIPSADLKSTLTWVLPYSQRNEKGLQYDSKYAIRYYKVYSLVDS